MLVLEILHVPKEHNVGLVLGEHRRHGPDQAVPRPHDADDLPLGIERVERKVVDVSRQQGRAAGAVVNPAAHGNVLLHVRRGRHYGFEQTTDCEDGGQDCRKKSFRQD